MAMGREEGLWGTAGLWGGLGVQECRCSRAWLLQWVPGSWHTPAVAVACSRQGSLCCSHCVLQSTRGTPACHPASPRPRCGSPWETRMTMHHTWRASLAPWRFLRTRVVWHSTPCGPLILMVERTDAWNTGWQVRCTGSAGLGKDFSLGFPGSGDITCSSPIPPQFSPAPNCMALLPPLSSLPPVKSTLRSRQAALFIPEACLCLVPQA